MKHLELGFQALLIKYFCGSEKEEDMAKKQAMLHEMFNADTDLLDYAMRFVEPEGYQVQYPSVYKLITAEPLNPKVNKLMTLFASRSSVLMLAVQFRDRAFARYLLERGATMGQVDAEHQTVVEHIAERQDFDQDTGAMLLHKYHTATPRGLIIGCGHGLGACRVDERGYDHYDGNHNHIHPREDFLTIDPRSEAGPEYTGIFAEFTSDPAFMDKHRGKFEIIIFESVMVGVLDLDPTTGRSKAFDAVSELLAPNGFVILAIGGGKDLKALAEQSGFTHGRYYDNGTRLIVSKYPEDILIKPWMQRACIYNLGQARSSERIFEMASFSLPTLTHNAFINAFTILPIPQKPLSEVDVGNAITPVQSISVETDRGTSTLTLR